MAGIILRSKCEWKKGSKSGRQQQQWSDHPRSKLGLYSGIKGLVLANQWICVGVCLNEWVKLWSTL